MENISEQSRPKQTITQPKHPRSCIKDCKVTHKHKAVCQLFTKQISYSTMTTNLQAHLQVLHSNEAVEGTDE